MKLGAPTLLLFMLSLVLAILALLGQLRPDLVSAEIVANRFWLMVGAYGVLTLGVMAQK
ncbi:MAG: hypothetical protein JSR45_15495 [Proteobacteria bacterium]|nr:hypothetical protein [Pseudomonadota bacterium]